MRYSARLVPEINHICPLVYS